MRTIEICGIGKTLNKFQFYFESTSVAIASDFGLRRRGGRFAFSAAGHGRFERIRHAEVDGRWIRCSLMNLKSCECSPRCGSSLYEPWEKAGCNNVNMGHSELSFEFMYSSEEGTREKSFLKYFSCPVRSSVYSAAHGMVVEGVVVR